MLVNPAGIREHRSGNHFPWGICKMPSNAAAESPFLSLSLSVAGCFVFSLWRSSVTNLVTKENGLVTTTLRERARVCVSTPFFREGKRQENRFGMV